MIKKVSGWLSRIDKDAKEARDKRIFDLWLACYTQEEIARKVGCPQQTASDILSEFTDFGRFAESGKIAVNHLVDFDPSLYNVWKFKEKSAGSKHPGNTEPAILDNLLYLYTKPLCILVGYSERQVRNSR